MTEEKKEEKPKKRQILIETDGSEIRIVKAEVAGPIEMIAILESVTNHLKTTQNKTNK